jgi:4-amino-4-deoxy-L-arabinose transferase-like glycosyltransferase
MLTLLALWLLATPGWRPLLLPDEGRYALVAWEMLHGDGLVPTLHGLPFFHKPPLMYWLDMAALQWLGPSVFAARIASALGAWLMGAALYLDLHRRAGADVAALALALLATTPFFFLGGQYANHDMLVAGCITVAIVCAARAVETDSTSAWRWAVAAWCAGACAVLAKGLIGVVLPGLVLLPWLLVQRRWRGLLRLLHPAALVSFVLIATPWFLLMQARYPGFFDYFFVEQHFRRFAQTGFNNAHPPWFFVAALPVLLLPWSAWGLGALLSRWRSAGGVPRAHDGAAGAPMPLYGWWTVAVLLFFSVPASKLVGYVLPALAPLVGMLALAAARGRAWRWLLPLAALACLAIVGALAWKAPGSQRDIGVALGQRLQAGDRVVFVDQPYFDVAFHAGLTRAPVLLADWDDPGIPRRDDWHKELQDAARFDPGTGEAVLWRTARAAQLLCGAARVWFVATPDWRPPPGLGGLQRVVRGRHADLLFAPGHASADCP